MQGVSLRRLPLLTAVAVAALVAAFFVSPASAGSTRTTLAWSNTCGSDFSSLSRFGGVSTARGTTTLREPALGQTVENPAPQRGRGRGFSVTVPTYVHIRVMNAGYSGAEGGYDTGFRFDLVGITRTVNADWYYAGPTTSAERAMKRALHQGGDNALNVYFTTAGPYLGWAYYPSILNSAQAYLDGVVVDWESMVHTSTRYEGQYDLGKTLTHESGHSFNLAHTFDGACNHWGDYVADTPAEGTPTHGCPEGKDTCSDPGLDPIHNYMDYSFDSCYNQFTQGQALRMQDAWLAYRAP